MGKGGRVGPDEEFSEYATARAERLRSVAYLMCGDWHQAQDLTQQTLTKLYLAWGRVSRRENVDAYARQILLRELISEKRRRRSTELPVAELPEQLVRPDQTDLRLTLIQGLGRLAPGRRAVIILRYWDDHSVETVAEILRISTGAVKSQTSRAIQDLRSLLGSELFGSDLSV
jgi:RNA polymerase sigma-70 factor (sigma-E family)